MCIYIYIYILYTYTYWHWFIAYASATWIEKNKTNKLIYSSHRPIRSLQRFSDRQISGWWTASSPRWCPGHRRVSWRCPRSRRCGSCCGTPRRRDLVARIFWGRYTWRWRWKCWKSGRDMSKRPETMGLKGRYLVLVYFFVWILIKPKINTCENGGIWEVQQLPQKEENKKSGEGLMKHVPKMNQCCLLGLAF